MSLKDYGWETYRVRSHSIPPSVSYTDSYYTADQRISRSGTSPSARKSISLQVTPPSSQSNSTTGDLLMTTSRREKMEPMSADVAPAFRFNSQQDSNAGDVKSKRSLTMPATMMLNTTEKKDIRRGKCRRFSQFSNAIEIVLVIIPEESLPSTPTNTATVTFQDNLDPSGPPLLVNVPIRRCSSISKDLTNTTITTITTITRDSGIASGTTGSFSDVECSRSPTYGQHPTHPQSPNAAVQSATDSLPLERFRPRSKSAHQSNALRQSKQLQKVPEVIQALRAPTAGHGGASEPSATDELYRSRLLRCNFLLKPDAAGYEYARRVQKISHATYSHLANSNNNESSMEDVLIKGKTDELLSPFRRFTSNFYKKMYQLHELRDHQIDRFLSDNGCVTHSNNSP